MGKGKTINVEFSDNEYEKLIIAKGDKKTWHDFILEKCISKNSDPWKMDLNLGDID